MTLSHFSTEINPKKILKILLGTTLVLVLLNVIALYLRFFPERYHVYNQLHEFFLDIYIDRFSMNTEMNIPTFFATFQLLAASILLFIIAAWKKMQKDKFRIHWKGLAFLLLLFSIDEFTAMHERFTKLFKDLPDFNGLFYFKWVIPGIAFVLIFGLLYLLFFLHLEKKYKILFLASAILFFGGALGFEVIGGRFANYNDTRNFSFQMIATVEETLELGGVSLLIYSLLAYMKGYFSEIGLVFNKEESS
ncbi:MAG: hypothetical protein GY755_24695 [Chloroflexi bacterium]|nr:hypothetical protein [Chloroflexota bacterium]